MSAAAATGLACAACGAAPPAGSPFAWRCPRADGTDDRDHLMARTLEAARVRYPHGREENPFARYRTLLHSWQVGRAAGMPDAEYLARLARLDERVAAVDGKGFRETPFASSQSLAARLGFTGGGTLRVKDETGNVAGSHKGRHLMGIALDLEVLEWLAPEARRDHDRRGLAIASCGNAALAAAVLARAAGRPLEAFVPAEAERPVVERLAALGARVTVCPRAGGGRGDPTLAAFRGAVAGGALPFCCQGSENGLAIEGGATMAWEMAGALAAQGAALERLFVQVGGGALVSACLQGLHEAVALGVLPRVPRVHAVQTAGSHPLARAYRRLRARVLAALGLPAPRDGPGPAEDARLADLMWDIREGPEVTGALTHAKAHRSEFMWPWEGVPHSIARGILDDETYDWHAALRGMIETAGFPVTASEDALREANEMARQCTGIAVDATGSAGLAGLAELRRAGVVAARESVAVLFTGAAR